MCESAFVFKVVCATRDFENSFFMFHFNLESALTSRNDHITHFKTTAGLWWYDNSNSKQTGRRKMWIGSEADLCVHDQRLSFLHVPKSSMKAI